jgi:hypothetical protein
MVATCALGALSQVSHSRIPTQGQRKQAKFHFAFELEIAGKSVYLGKLRALLGEYRCWSDADDVNPWTPCPMMVVSLEGGRESARSCCFIESLHPGQTRSVLPVGFAIT